MALTINDIAALAGVAKSTVSRYLNNGYVSEQTKAKISAVIAQTHYEPNSFAQSLKAKSSKLIGIIAPTLDSYVTSSVLMAADDQLRKRGYISLIANTNRCGEREIESILNFTRQKVDGIILFSTHVTEKLIEAIDRSNTPVVVVAQTILGVPSVVNNDSGAGFAMGQCVAKSGHQHVAYLGVNKEDIAVGVQRLNGVMAGLASEGVTHVDCYESLFTASSAEKVATQMLKLTPPSAIICATDTIAFGVMKALLKAGKQIPTDISLAGFGGYAVSELTHPALTTIRFDHQQCGRLAVSTLLATIKGESVPAQQVVDFTFIRGESVKNVTIS